MRLIVWGCCGKMGKMTAETAAERGHTVVCGVDLSPSPMPFPVVARAEEIGEGADVVIDFSSPALLAERLTFCRDRRLPIVLAATGFSAEEEALAEKFGAALPVFRAKNLSLGVNVLCRLVKEAARLLGGTFDAEIVERHHRQKKDAPSGTALMLFKSAEEGLCEGREMVCGRAEQGERRDNEIGVHSVRGGTIVGEHEVMFAGEDEVITLTHAAGSRKVFAAGALRAAEWLIGKPNGLYGMDDLLGGTVNP